MNILILTYMVPFPPAGGYQIVVYNTIKYLVQEGLNVTLFSLNPPTKSYVDVDDITDPLLGQITFESFDDVHTEVTAYSAFMNLFSRESYNVARYYSPEAAQRLEHLLRRGKFDIVQFEGLYVVPYLNMVRQASTAKIIYRSHHIESIIWEKRALFERSIPRKTYLSFLQKRLYGYESTELAKFDRIFAISAQDRDAMLRFNLQVKIDVIPVALEADSYKADYSRTSFPTIFHLGTMDKGPTFEGISWFVANVWPDVERIGRDLRFYLAGRNMPAAFYRHPSENLIVEGEITDAKDFINSKAIMVVPMLSGSGMRVKIIEGMLLGRCIIATSLAAEGIKCRHGYDILIANTAEEFYRTILQCLIQPGLWKSIGTNARLTALKNHDCSVVMPKLLRVYNEMLNG